MLNKYLIKLKRRKIGVFFIYLSQKFNHSNLCTKT